MLTALLVVVATVVTLGLLLPLALLYLLARQVLPARPLATLLVLLAGVASGRLLGLLAAVAVVALLQCGALPWRARAAQRPAASHGRLARPWASLLRDAAAARDRYRETVQSLRPGPLRSRLGDLGAEVDAAVAEAHDLARHGDRVSRSCTQVEHAVAAQRRRVRHAAAGDPLVASLRAQQASAERLATAAVADRRALQLLVARLDELAAHVAELEVLAVGARPSALDAIAEQAAALRAATVEVARLDAA